METNVTKDIIKRLKGELENIKKYVPDSIGKSVAIENLKECILWLNKD